MNQIINFTQHVATPSQIAAGVVELNEPAKTRVKELLNFYILPTATEIKERAQSLASVARHECDVRGTDTIMIGGAPFLMGLLEKALRQNKIEPVYAFSRRESEEVTGEDGSVTKRNVFRHLGFVSNV